MGELPYIYIQPARTCPTTSFGRVGTGGLVKNYIERIIELTQKLKNIERDISAVSIGEPDSLIILKSENACFEVMVMVFLRRYHNFKVLFLMTL
jgi:hypothetical protein